MRKYTFSQGQITVEDGVYSPALRVDEDDHKARSGVLILVKPILKNGQEPDNLKEQEQNDVKE